MRGKTLARLQDLERELLPPRPKRKPRLVLRAVYGQAKPGGGGEGPWTPRIIQAKDNEK